MSISTILDQKLDSRKNGDDCQFNGYLEDYLSLQENELDPVLREAFTAIQTKEPDTRICVGLKTEISRDAISNQIIRYKDVFKLNGKPMVCPYILYLTKNEDDRALLVIPHTEYGYIYAKGLYYCMTEPGSDFIDCKNEIVAMSADSAEAVVKAFDSLFNVKAGALQRGIDRENFKNYEELKEAAVAAAENLKKEAPAELLAAEDRTSLIYQNVIRWFLLKKVLYVQYMVNKNILNTVHEGNVKKQRNQAKVNADSVTFLSYSEMWRITDEPAEEPEQQNEEDV